MIEAMGTAPGFKDEQREKRHAETFAMAHVALNAVIQALAEIDSPHVQRRVLRAADAYWDLDTWQKRADETF